MKKIISISLIWGLCWLFFGFNPVFAADLEQGAKIFEANCAGCHLHGGNIIRRGKNLKQKTLQKNKLDTPEAIAQLVTNGKNNMPAYRDRLSQVEIDAVANYVLQQAEAGWK